MASFLSVLFLDLFGAVIVGSILAIAYSKWEQAHPGISLHGNVLKVRGNIYYGSLPVIESMYHNVIDREGSVTIDFSDCYYIDREGIRWLSAAKARQKFNFIDRRKTFDRRLLERRATSDKKRKAGRRRSELDRRQRSEF